MNEFTRDRLAQLRERIDAVDAELLDALNRRARYVIEVGRIKQREQAQILDSERETQLMERLTQLNQGPLTDGMVQKMFQSIIDLLKEFQSVPEASEPG